MNKYTRIAQQHDIDDLDDLEVAYERQPRADKMATKMARKESTKNQRYSEKVARRSPRPGKGYTTSS